MAQTTLGISHGKFHFEYNKLTQSGIPPTVYEAFKAFSTDHSQFALLLQISTGKLHTLAAIAFPSNPESTFQNALFQLESVINAHTPLFVIIRQNRSLSAITYIPYLADSKLKEQYLANRNLLVQSLGESLFSVSVICKDPGAILDARAWEERQSTYRFMDLHHGHDGDAEYDSCEKDEPQQTSVIDLGYKKTKCRLCDRRMKNKLEEDGLSALRNLNGGGDCVQLVRNTRLRIPCQMLMLQ
jgi:twinfilin-like protein